MLKNSKLSFQMCVNNIESSFLIGSVKSELKSVNLFTVIRIMSRIVAIYALELQIKIKIAQADKLNRKK